MLCEIEFHVLRLELGKQGIAVISVRDKLNLLFEIHNILFLKLCLDATKQTANKSYK